MTEEINYWETPEGLKIKRNRARQEERTRRADKVKDFRNVAATICAVVGAMSVAYCGLGGFLSSLGNGESWDAIMCMGDFLVNKYGWTGIGVSVVTGIAAGIADNRQKKLRREI